MENWKHILESDRYMVSDQGNVKSLSWHGSDKEQLLKPGKSSRGYLFVYLMIKGKRVNYKIHQLVWITFKEDYRTGSTKGLVLNHINRVKEDNRLTNLELITHSENLIHSIDKTKTTSKYPNVSWNGSNKKWAARGNIRGMSKRYVKHFNTEEEAYEAFQSAKREAENIYS